MEILISTRSRSDLIVSQKLERSASRSKFLDEVKQKRKDVEGEIEKQKILEEEERKVVEEAKKKEKSRQIQKEREEAEIRKRKGTQSLFLVVLSEQTCLSFHHTDMVDKNLESGQRKSSNV